jgi:hypothetical protein
MIKQYIIIIILILCYLVLKYTCLKSKEREKNIETIKREN